MSDNYLIHHGILGQRWGKLNGPPYPLGSSDHSSAEKSAAKSAGVSVGSSSGKGSYEAVKKMNNKEKKHYLKSMSKDMNDHFKSQISKEAAKVTKIDDNGHDQRGSSWNKAFRKGKVTSKDDAQIKKAASETRNYMKEKYGESAVKELSKRGVLGHKIGDFEVKTIDYGKNIVSDTKPKLPKYVSKDGYQEPKFPKYVLKDGYQAPKLPRYVIH